MSLDPDEIIVTLRDLTEAGFKKLDSSLSGVENKANSVNMSGFSKSAKGVEKDAESAAGKEVEGGGGSGIMGMIGALTGIPGPAALAVGGVAALSGILFEAGQTSEKVEKQQNLLNAALQAHGDSLDKEQGAVDAMIKSNEAWGANADDTRGAITELAQAGQSMSDIEKEMPSITDLATAKHEDLATAAKQVELAEMGNAKALKELGIVLPKTGISTKDLQTAQDAASKASTSLAEKQAALTVVEDKLGKKHTLTAAEALQLKKAQDAVTAAQNQSTLAQQQLSIVQEGGADKASRLTMVTDALTKQLGNQQSAVSPMQVVTAKMNDTWEKFSMKVGPGVQQAITMLLNNVVVPLMDDASSLIDYLSQVWGWLEKVGVINDVSAAFGVWVKIEQTGLDVIRNLIGLLAQLFDKIGQVGKAIQNSPIGAFGGAVSNATGAVGGALGGIGSLIPHFAQGGYVPATPGGTLALVGEGGRGEYITPEGQGGGETHLHVHFDCAYPPTPQQAQAIVAAINGPLGRLLSNSSTSTRFGLGGIG